MSRPPPAEGLYRVAPAPGEHSIETYIPLINHSVDLDDGRMAEQLALGLADFACREPAGR
ncbi:hypothetical protein ACFYPA_27175 [Streptomyces sp. NPDC005775]|uniref:hypothetical protein n=1 Tax=Streptomyces sp. NPDC005775 TaxID=3364729 RepID=UPI0036D0A232